MNFKTSLVIFIFFINLSFSNLKEIEVNAKYAILINAKNNKVLYEKKSKIPTYPASITKAASVFYILNNHEDKLNNFHIPTKDALKIISPEKITSNLKNNQPYILETDGTMFDIIEGERLKLENLLFAMMVVSGNDASNVAAEMVDGSINKFMENLNVFLKKIGCADTSFLNPHGLHHPNHLTTAYDLALLLSQANQNEKFMQLYSCNYFIREQTNKQKYKELKTNNKLLKPNKFQYKYTLGSKTGYHAKAKYNLSAIAKKNDRELIAVVLNCDNSEKRYVDVINLFENAFKEEKISKKLIDKSQTFQAKLDGASKNIKGHIKEDFILKYYLSEETNYKMFIQWDDLKLPIKANSRLGFIKVISEESEVLDKLPLYATGDVNRSFLRFLKDLFL